MPRELLNAARLTTQRSRSCSRAQGHANEVSGSLTRHKGETRSCTSSKLVSTINTIMPRGKKGQQANKVKDQNIMQFCLSMHSQVKVKNVCQQSRCYKGLVFHKQILSNFVQQNRGILLSSEKNNVTIVEIKKEKIHKKIICCKSMWNDILK